MQLVVDICNLWQTHHFASSLNLLQEIHNLKKRQQESPIAWPQQAYCTRVASLQVTCSPVGGGVWQYPVLSGGYPHCPILIGCPLPGRTWNRTLDRTSDRTGLERTWDQRSRLGYPTTPPPRGGQTENKHYLPPYFMHGGNYHEFG